MGIIDEQASRYARAQACEWVAKVASSEILPACNALPDADELNQVEEEEEPTEPVETCEGDRGTEAPGAHSPVEAGPPRGGDLEADAAAGEKFYATEQGGEPGQSLACAEAEDARHASAARSPADTTPGGAPGVPPVATEIAAEDTVLIFDWDDTLLPSSWLTSQKLRLDSSSTVSVFQRDQLAALADIIVETLRMAKEHGTVVIVTNAERGWIELTCHKFMPTLWPILEGIKMISARSTYETSKMPSPVDWKLRAFESEIKRIFGQDADELHRVKNVVSLGDSVHEREALIRSTSALPNCRSKSLKFVAKPSIGQICQQHSLVRNCLGDIVQHNANLDLCLRCT